MLNHQTITVVLPAYSAAKFLSCTVEEISRETVDDIILTNDAQQAGKQFYRAAGYHLAAASSERTRPR